MLRWNRRNDFLALSLSAAFAVAASLLWAAPAHAYKVQITDAGTNVRWHASTVTLRIDPELEAYFGDMPIGQLVGEAAAAWAGLEGAPELLTSRGAPAETLGFHRETASNGVYLVEDWTLWPDALAATVATFESNSGKLIDTDIQVNANFAFDWRSLDDGALDRYDLVSVLTHEMGHVLGLADADDAPGATMWPSVAPGDTYQRDLDADDEAGVARIYTGVPVAESLGGAGCGGASVLWPLSAQTRNSHGLWIAALILIALWVWSRRRRDPARARHRPRSPGRFTIVLGGVLLFGGLFPAPAAPAPAPADPFSGDAPTSTRWLAREDPVARQRLAKFVQGSYGLIKGRTVRSRAERRGGVIWTHFHVRGEFGVAELDVPGGSLGSLTQIVSGHALPREGQLLLVALRKHGPHGWAHFDQGKVYGGSLGSGPALSWQ